MKYFRGILKIFFIGLFLVISGIFSLYIYNYFSTPINIYKSNHYTIYDDQDNLIFKGNNNIEIVDLNSINKNLINAVISVEDKKFYKHHGFDIIRIIKTMSNNLIAGKITGGASTISQQLVKNIYLDFSKTYKRKIKEAYLTINLETHYSKDEILSAYLNTINFGNGNYGIENASLSYFDKHANELTLEESLILAGIPKNPTNYNPITHYDNATKRAKLIAKLMLDNNYLTIEQYNNLNFNNISLNSNENYIKSDTINYYYDAVLNELNEINSIPKYLKNSNIKIYTSLNYDSQINMENSIKNNMSNTEMQVGSILVNPNNGEVKALIGGKNYYESQYNRVLSAKRQVGSTIKPFLYYCALNSGMTSSSTFLSEYTNFYFADNKVYSPKNFNDKYANKDITMAAAISYSDNIYAVKTHLFLGEDILVNYLKKLGITSKLETIPSLALGTNELNMFEYATAYTTLASNGYKHNLHFIKKITDLNDNILYEYKEPVVLINNPNLVYIINDLMTSTYNINFKDYNNPTVLNIASKLNDKYAIKTGTTDTDFWLVGYNQNALMLVWNGYDDSKYIDTKDYQISRNIWLDTIIPYEKNIDNNWYNIPKNIVGVPKNAITGTDNFNNNNFYTFYYVKGTQ